jgi:hypothetical protein
LQALFGDEIDEGHFLIWTAPDKRSAWFQNTDEAAKHVASLDDKKHVYFGIGLSPKDMGPAKRCPAHQIQALSCLGVDLDVVHDTKSNKPYFESKEEAHRFIQSVLSKEFQPTVIIDSGHGLIPIWIFNEPWELSTNEEHNRAARFLRRFVYTIRYYATLRGRDIDSTNDLARVYRLPGTWNCKDEDNPVQAKILESNENLFNPHDFDEWLMDPPHEDPSAVTDEQHQNYFKINIDATRPEPRAKINALKDADSLFKATWDMTRKDMAKKSLSEYDMALANLCVKYDVPVQEIADMIIAFRNEHGQTTKDIQKAYRISYLNTTIQKAKAVVGWNEADEELESAYVQLKQHERDDSVPRPDAEKIKDKLNLVLGCPIEKIKKYPGDKSTYEIVLTTGQEIPIGEVENLINQGRLRAKIADATQLFLTRYKTDVWDKYAELLLKLVTEEDVGIDATIEGQIFQFIHQYVGETSLQENPRYASITQQPFKDKDGQTHIFLDSFITWLGHYKIQRSDLAQKLRKLGASQRTKNFYEEDGEGKERRTSKSTYDVTPILQANYKNKILKFQQETKTNDNQGDDSHGGSQGVGGQDK